MRKIVSFKQAGRISLLLFAIIILFHLSVIIGILIFNYVPIDFLWGGRMETREQLIGFEIISAFVSALCFFVISLRIEWIRIPKMNKIARIALWILFIIFLLNTIGNILAETTFEKFFSLLTAIISLLVLRLAIEKDTKSP